MNKQRLAAKIWASVNKMRSKIEASEYKDYILGFVFYKYLSDKEVMFLRSGGWTEAGMKTYLNADMYDPVDAKHPVNYVRKNLGYFIQFIIFINCS